MVEVSSSTSKCIIDVVSLLNYSMTNNVLLCFIICSNRPADLNSFAVLNLAGDRNSCSYDFMKKFLTCAKDHGLKMPDAQPGLILDNLIVHAKNTDLFQVRT